MIYRKHIISLNHVLHQSVSEIIETRKLVEAKNLLVTTDKTIAEIGFDLGFNEKTYFTHASCWWFRRTYLILIGYEEMVLLGN